MPSAANIRSSFGTIRNNTALKLKLMEESGELLFWNHSKQHSSKTLDNVPKKVK